MKIRKIKLKNLDQKFGRNEKSTTFALPSKRNAAVDTKKRHGAGKITKSSLVKHDERYGLRAWRFITLVSCNFDRSVTAVS
ncbi:hypothetical protein ACWKWU_22795, partial [Chitinophaga lutea]